jgi:hypothetical protein
MEKARKISFFEFFSIFGDFADSRMVKAYSYKGNG